MQEEIRRGLWPPDFDGTEHAIFEETQQPGSLQRDAHSFGTAVRCNAIGHVELLQQLSDAVDGFDFMLEGFEERDIPRRCKAIRKVTSEQFGRQAQATVTRSPSTASEPNTPLLIPIITPLENTGPTNAYASPTMM